MRKSFKVLAAVGIGAAIGIGVALFRAPSIGATYRAADLPSVVHTGRAASGRIRVLLRFPARPTDDPLVWEYRPSLYGTLPRTILFRFDSPRSAPFSDVEGESPTMTYDLLRRRGDVPGFVVLSACSVPP